LIQHLDIFLFLGHYDGDFIKAKWKEVVFVHRDIGAEGWPVVGQIAVRVTKKVPASQCGAVLTAGPGAIGVMMKEYLVGSIFFLVDANYKGVVNSGKDVVQKMCRSAIFVDRIVIADDQIDLAAFDPVAIFSDFFNVGFALSSQTEVANNIQFIFLSNGVVYVGNNGVVHLFNAGKRSLAMLDDIGMAKVRVRREI